MPALRDINSPPPLWWSFSEPRVGIEIAQFYAARRKLLKLPKGDGHGVLVIPGFLSGDGTTALMRGYLRRMNYDVYGWGLGQNMKFTRGLLVNLGARLEAIFKKTGRKVSVIGWSLGGMYARELAKLYPDYVRMVITLGSPISGNFSHTPAYQIYRRMNGRPTPEQVEYYATLKLPPPVPTVSVYSKSDGVVAWRNSIQADSPLTENIRVSSSHFGMGANPNVMRILADRLALPEGQWTKYIPPVTVKKKSRKAKLA